MDKDAKNNIINSVIKSCQENDYLFVFNFKGLKSNDFFSLRKSLFDETGDKVVVVKNKINSIAIRKSDDINSKDDFINRLKGQIAIVATKDPIAVSSILNKFVTFEKISFEFFSDKSTISEKEDLHKMAKFINENGLKSYLVGILKSSYNGIAGVLNQKSSI
ncbi:50S ribosomal protein L10 [Candidatus Deianiraea vastatrix]|uniref:Large ribosomal subunit protein uL10 n=1 Tax=Candidatus Deianiraea vastatrix TaxID=2163644 RepID=A0A5B8XE44_9RICK|nr:50S ribosomal protein L10 [Candidatus Deianiraea vastatrix]QED23145.1 50S ribosomal protein L10 [Candidatus Deianiraea vastatrix]